ncbi:MAG: efflux RND transporter permease subunit, partial [Sinobacterium sp.]|nr:efflux RND transporter permease subunit [Sinobacterium sp.]
MISNFFLSRPKFALVISLIITLAGLISLSLLPIAEYPHIAPPQVVVSAQYPGASSEIIEQTVAGPIEDAVNGVEGMTYMRSISSNAGSYSLAVAFDLEQDPDMALVRVQNAVATAEPKLPSDVRKLGLNIKKQSPDMLMIINLSSPDSSLDYLFMSNFAKINIESAIQRIPGIASASILGAADYSMRLWLNPERMASLGVTASDVQQVLNEQNIQVPVGRVGAPPFDQTVSTEYSLRAKGRLTDISEFESIVVRSRNDGSQIYLKDIARIELGQASYAVSGELNQKPAISLALYLTPDANALDTEEMVMAEMKLLEAAFPPGLEWDASYNTTRYVRVSINQVVESLYQAIILVIIVTFIFLGNWRATLVPAIAIPVSLIGTFAVLNMFGMSINTVTLFGLILAIGIVVDDAILVIENVERHMSQNPEISTVEATRRAMHEVTGPVIATTLVLLAVFIPVTLLPGISGQMYLQIGMTICISVLISSVNALTLSPVLCSLLLKPNEKPAKWYVGFNKIFDKVTSGYGNTVRFLIRKSFIAFILLAAMVGIMIQGFTTVPADFVPYEDKGLFLISVQLPDASSLTRTNAAVKKVEAILEEDENIESVTAITGYGIFTGTAQSNAAVMFVVMKPWEERFKDGMGGIVFNSIKRVNQEAKTRVLEAEVMAIPAAPIPGVGSTGGIELVIEDTLGQDYTELADNLKHLVIEGSQSPSVASAFTTFRANVPQYFVDVDRVKAKTLGISLTEIFVTLQSQLGSSYINDFNKFGQTYQVIMQADSKYRDAISDLDKFYLRTSGGDMVPLTNLVKITPILGPDNVWRYNKFRAGIINATIAQGYATGEVIQEFETLAQSLPDSFKYEWTGQAFEQIKAGNAAVVAFALALVFIYLFLVAQYESWSIPAAILMVIPVALAGSMAALMITGMSLNLYAQIGLILLIGMASKNA